MSIETAKDSLVLNQIIEQKRNFITVEDDCIVPDVKPDILNIISTSGIVCIYKKEILDGKIRLDGCVNTYIMYLADTEENQVRSINTNLNFTQIIDMEKAKSNMTLNSDVVLKGLDCKVLNGRKINVKAELEIDNKISSNETIEFIKEINHLKDVQFLNKEFQINSLVGQGSTKIYAKDTINIDETDNLVEIMKTDLRITNRDTKISYNKVLIKADLEVKIIYLTEDNKINIKEAMIPAVGFIDLNNISEEHTCEIKYEIKNIIVKPNNIEEHSVYVEAEIEVYCEAHESKQLEMIQDLYSPTVTLDFSKRKIRVSEQKKIKSQIFNFREKQSIPEITNCKIYDVGVKPVIQEQTVLKDKIIYNGDVNLNFIYSSNTGISTKEISLPFNYTLDFEGISRDEPVETIIEITIQNFIIMPDETIEMKVDLNFTAISGKDIAISIIDQIEQSSENKILNGYSMVIYFTKPNDTLWEIAKKFGSTKNAISRLNGIENVDILPVGKQLFIPRYHG